jgi:hypothetical protein
LGRALRLEIFSQEDRKRRKGEQSESFGVRAAAGPHCAQRGAQSKPSAFNATQVRQQIGAQMLGLPALLIFL